MPKATQVSTAGRLKYAEPRDLPSYPSSGLGEISSAASAAASLGWANQKSPSEQKKASSASAAAVLAKDYKSSSVCEPANSNGANRAALLAVGSADAALKQASSTQDTTTHKSWGNSAATQAFHANNRACAESTSTVGGSAAATQAFHNSNRMSTPESASQSSPAQSIEQRSLAAAKGAMALSRSDSGRRPNSRSRDTYALEASAASSALNGAALAHRNSVKAKSNMEDVGAVPITNLNRNMFTSQPPVKVETDEEKIHQTAVEMARKMYQIQQKKLEQTKDQHKDDSSTPFAGTYLNLQDAAYKQAQERLAKLQDEHQQGREAQEYYGNVSSSRHRFSMANKLRRRSASDPDSEDKVRSDQIRAQMSMFSSKLSQIDTEKRTKDREALLAAAQRNVKARLQGMDEKLFFETGKRNTSISSDWELKAQQAAQARSVADAENRGKIDIGGGKFMTSEEINAIAAKRLQPVLDDINEKAATERARLATLKAEEDARCEELERIKAEERAEKEEAKKIKDEEKARRAEAKQEIKTKKEEEKERKAQEKEELKARKEQEKAEKTEQQRQAKEEKRRSKLDSPVAVSTTEGTTATASEVNEKQTTRPAAEASDDDSDDLLDTDDDEEEHRVPGAASASGLPPSHVADSTDSVVRKSVEGPVSLQKANSGVKGWIKKRFSISLDKNPGAEKVDKEPGEKRRSFFGGISRARTTSVSHASDVSLEKQSSNFGEVALADKIESDDTGATATASAAPENKDTTLHSVADKAPSLNIEEPHTEWASSVVAEVNKEVSAASWPTKTAATAQGKDKADSRGVSPIGTPAIFEDAAEERSRSLEPPKPLEQDGRRSSSIARDSRFIEEI